MWKLLAEPQAQRARSRLPWPAIAAFAFIAAMALWAPWRAARPVPQPFMRFNAELGADAVAGARMTAAISPDGTRLAYTVRLADGTLLLATRLLDQSKATVLSGTENAEDPFFSPDGQWIGFSTGRALKKGSILGGAPSPLCAADNVRGGKPFSRGTELGISCGGVAEKREAQ